MNDLKQLFYLAKRHFKVFASDKLSFGFSFLSPMIVFLLFILFLYNVQVEGLKSHFIGNPFITDIDKIARIITSNWMICAMISVSVITISISVSAKIVDDKVNNVDYLFKASPIKKGIVISSYLLSAFFSSFIINFTFYCLTIIYLIINHALYLSFVSFLYGILIIICGVLSSVAIFLFIYSFLTKTTQVVAVTTILSTLVGFLIGAYIPLSVMPSFVRKIVSFVPGFYSTSLFKKVYFKGVFEEILKTNNGYEENLVKAIKNNLTYDTKFFDSILINDYVSIIILLVMSGIFLGLTIIVKTREFKYRKQKAVIKN